MEITKSKAAIDLSAGKTFDEFVGSSDLRSVSLSLGFESAVKECGKVTLAAFADMGCPDCRAVLPFLKKIHDANPDISVMFVEWNAESEKFLQDRLSTGRVPTVLALSSSGTLMDGAFIERPLGVHKAAAEAASRKDAMIAVGKFRNGGCDALIEEDLLKVLRGEKNDVLQYLK